MTTSAEPASLPVAEGTGLRAGVLGLFDSVVMAVAGSAPAGRWWYRQPSSWSPDPCRPDRSRSACSAVGAAFMFWILGEFVATNTSDAVVIWVGLGGLAIGFIPLAIYWMIGSPYFEQRPTLGSVVPDDAGGVVQAP
jgi:hypothetical protein